MTTFDYDTWYPGETLIVRAVRGEPLVTAHIHEPLYKRQEGIDKVRIFNKEGTIIYSSDKEEVDAMVDKQAEACDICHSGDEPLKGLTLRERTRIFEGGGGFRFSDTVLVTDDGNVCLTDAPEQLEDLIFSR